MVDLTIELRDETRDQIVRLLTSGEFATADAVVAAGVRLLAERRAARDRLSADIAEGLDQLDRGEGLDGEAVFRQLHAKIAAAADGRA